MTSTRKGAPGGKAVMPTLAATCPGQLAKVTGELTELQAKMESRLTFDEIFERSAPSEENEQRVREAVDKVFAKAPKGYSYTAECRGEICSVDVIAPDKGDWDWNMAIQTDAYHKISEGLTIHSGRPGQDPVTKEPVTITHTQVWLADAKAADGVAILRELFERFKNGDARRQCSAADASHGYLVLALSINNVDHSITYDAGGDLPATSLGRCLLAALDAAITATVVPGNVRSSMLYQTLEIL